MAKNYFIECKFLIIKALTSFILFQCPFLLPQWFFWHVLAL